MVSVFPVPPLGPRTEIIVAVPVAGAAPRRRATAFSSANASCAGGSGSVIRSSAPAANASSMNPFGLPTCRTTTGRSGRCRAAASTSPSTPAE